MLTKKERELLRQQRIDELEETMAHLHSTKARLLELSDSFDLLEQHATMLMQLLGLERHQVGNRVFYRPKPQEKMVLSQSRLKRRYRRVYRDCLVLQITQPKYQYYEEIVKVEQLKTREVCGKSGSPSTGMNNNIE